MNGASESSSAKAAKARARLDALDRERAVLIRLIEHLESDDRDVGPRSGIPVGCSAPPDQATPAGISNFTQTEKVRLFRTLFRGRDDVYAVRFESAHTGRSGYQPACRNDWVAGICGKPKMKCSACPNRELLPLNDAVVRAHIVGQDPQKPQRDFVAGLYPLLTEETCWFLAVDFDKATWIEDVGAFREVCESRNVPVAVERSRSGIRTETI